MIKDTLTTGGNDLYLLFKAFGVLKSSKAFGVLKTSLTQEH